MADSILKGRGDSSSSRRTSKESDRASRSSRGTHIDSVSTLVATSLGLPSSSAQSSSLYPSDGLFGPLMVTYGGFEGPGSQYVRITSADEHMFIVPRHLAIMSATMRSMLMAEDESNYLQMVEIPSHMMHKICCYLTYKAYFEKNKMAQEDFNFTVEPHLALPLLMAANFLRC